MKCLLHVNHLTSTPQVVKWVGAGLFLLQLLTLLLSCGLQSAYASADEAAEDEEDEAAWRRRPLLQQQARGRAATPPYGAPGGWVASATRGLIACGPGRMRMARDAQRLGVYGSCRALRTARTRCAPVWEPCSRLCRAKPLCTMAGP